jgi:predicted RNase H-like nuclease (RuvC/YqgF family)
MSANANAMTDVCVLKLKLELLDKLAKELSETIKKRDQRIEELTRRNQQLEALQNLRRNCKCISTTEFYHTIHEKHCHCTWCDPAGN